VPQDIAIERIDGGVVDVGREHAFAQVIEYDHLSDATKSVESFLIQFGPRLRAGAEDQQPNALAAVAEREYEQTGPAVLAGGGVAHHGACAVINL
jgi:hypothetical protein